MKTMNKVIAAMMMMAITTTVPVMAGNRKHYNGKNDKVVVVVDKKASHFDTHKRDYRPAVRTCTFKVSRHASLRKVVATTERMMGVMNTKWNPLTREMTVIYDAKVTSVRHIMHSVA